MKKNIIINSCLAILIILIIYQLLIEKKNNYNFIVGGLIKPKFFIKLSHGLGNQLFMLFYCLSLDYNHELFLYDKVINDYQFSILDCLNLVNINIPIIDTIPNFQFVKILDTNNVNTNLRQLANKNYLFDAYLSGYFLSYKYFWYKLDKITKIINFPISVINKIRNIYNKIRKNKKILSIHMRLTDYLYRPDYALSIDYYIQAFNRINLYNYDIILFSDDIKMAKNMLKPYINLPLNDIKRLNLNDFEELLLLSFSDVRICPNSTFSLWSCYLNDIYKFNKNDDTLYYVPSHFAGSFVHIDDLIPKEKSYIKINV